MTVLFGDLHLFEFSREQRSVVGFEVETLAAR